MKSKLRADAPVTSAVTEDRKPRVLYLAPHSPAATNGGGRIRCAFIARAVASCGDLCVWVLNNPLGADDPARVDVPWEHWEAPALADSLAAKLARHARGLILRDPITVEYYVDAGRRREIAAKLASFAPNVVILGDSHLGALLPLVRQHAPAARVILDTHNVEWMIFDRLARTDPSALARFRYRILADCTRALEERAASGADEVWVVSASEEAVFRGFGATSVHVVPNAIELAHYHPAPLRADRTISFLGNFSYPPNEHAALALASASRRLHDAGAPHTLRIAGRGTPKSLRDAAHGAPHILVVGEVACAQDEMLRSDIFAAPLAAGAGTKLKIIEALALGRAVVTTKVGIEGLDVVPGEHAIVAEGAAFAEALAGLLASPERAQSLADAGARWVRDHLDPEPIRARIAERVTRVAP